MENKTSNLNESPHSSNVLLSEVKILSKRGHPCICVSCPKCGNVFMGAILSARIMVEDRELMDELEKYGREGYAIDVRDANDFKLYGCKCELCAG